MALLNRFRAFVGAVPRHFVRKKALAFLARTTRCRETQRETLLGLLALNAASEFSRTHGLDKIVSPEEFRRALPVGNFETVRPYVERLKTGDVAALLGPENKLLMFGLSSGTTAESKFIPITNRFLADYRDGWQTWGILTIDDHPGISRKKIIQLSSNHNKFQTPGGTPCGNISGLVTAMQKKIVQSMYSVPGGVCRIADPEAKTYATLRLAVADPLAGMFTTANPSTLIHLARVGDAEKERLIRDIHDGTLSAEISPDVRAELGSRLTRRNPARARQLEAIAQRTGHLYPRDYWTEAEVLAVWTGGSVGAYLPTVKELYGDLPTRDHGLHATEGRMTIPLADNTSAGVLDISSHYFEFIPEAEADSKHPVVLEAHELEAGANYFILLTTSSGLYRYNISDVVQCTGFYNDTPLLKFLHKGAYISNLTGEKVSESQVVAAVGQAGDALRLRLGQFTLTPVWEDPPRYWLLAEGEALAEAAVREQLAVGIDRELQRLNCEYEEKRRTARLAPLRVLALPTGVWQQYARKKQSATGGSVEQYKHPCLIPDRHFAAKFLPEYAPQSSLIADAS